MGKFKEIYEALDRMEPSQGQMKPILSRLRDDLGVEGKPVWKAYLLNRENSSNKYHYFAIFKAGDEFAVANAYGRIGKVQGTSDLGNFDSKADAIKAATKKMKVKEKKGYYQSKFENLGYEMKTLRK